MFDAVQYLNDPAWFSSRYGLDRMRDLMARLGNPQDSLTYILVAGTIGKVSTCAYMDAILRAAGYRVWLYTSPYIEVFEERIRVNGENIPAASLERLTLRVRDAAEAMVADARAQGDPEPSAAHPTAFELMTAVAFLYFAEQHCDIVILEVGLGGALDATNVIAAPEVAVIARLSLDHTEILGDTLAEIASQKAGIIKQGCTVVTARQEPEAQAVVSAAARAAGCELRTSPRGELHCDSVVWPGDVACAMPSAPREASLPQAAGEGGEGDASAGSDSQSVAFRPFSYAGETYRTRLLATYQPSNAALAIDALCALRDRGWDIPQSAYHEGIFACTWPGRFEVVGANPLRIVDGGHNEQGAAVLVDSLRSVLPEARPVFILGVLADKDYRAMASLLAGVGSAFFCVTPPSPRALAAEALAEVVREYVGEGVGEGVPVEACASFDDATERAHAALGTLSAEALGTPPCFVAAGSR